jgi:hypothetical protein
VTALVRVVSEAAPAFVAGLLIEDDVCFAAAPILGWSVGKTTAELRAYFAKRGWKATIVRDKAPEPVVEG